MNGEGVDVFFCNSWSVQQFCSTGQSKGKRGDDYYYSWLAWHWSALTINIVMYLWTLCTQFIHPMALTTSVLYYLLVHIPCRAVVAYFFLSEVYVETLQRGISLCSLVWRAANPIFHIFEVTCCETLQKHLLYKWQVLISIHKTQERNSHMVLSTRQCNSMSVKWTLADTQTKVKSNKLSLIIMYTIISFIR